MNSQQIIGQEVTLRQIFEGKNFVLQPNSFLKVRVIFAQKATVSQTSKTVPPPDPHEIGQIIFADHENHIEGVFDKDCSPALATHFRNAINMLIKLKGKVIILKNFTVEKRPPADFCQTLLKKQTKRLRLSGRLMDFKVYDEDKSTTKILKHLPFQFTPLERLDLSSINDGHFIDIIGFCEDYEDTQGAKSNIEYRKVVVRSTRSTKKDKGCSYQIACFDNRKEIKCKNAVYAIMNVKVTTFSRKKLKSLKTTPSTIIIKLELDAKKRTDECLDYLPPKCRNESYVLDLLPSRMTSRKPAASKRKASDSSRIPLKQLRSSNSSVVMTTQES